jgi:hypothetical protein
MFWLILLGFLLSGALMKLTDDMEDTWDKNPPLTKKMANITGITYGVLIAYLMVHDEIAATLFSGIILGCLISGKIDTKSHHLALATILLIVFSQGLQLSTHLVLILTALSAIDEYTNDLQAASRFLKKVLEYRIALKIGVLILALSAILHWHAVAYLLSFDAAYILTGRATSTQ